MDEVASRDSLVDPTDPQCSGQALGDDEQEQITTSKSEPSSRSRASKDGGALHLATSTFFSLVMVLALLLFARTLVPSIVESVRYSWHLGQLRAEYELSGQRLSNVSLDSLETVSELVSQRVGPSVVHINVLRKHSPGLEQVSDWFDAGPHASLVEGQGSGFIFDADGYVMTNHHVVSEGDEFEVILNDGRQLTADLIGVDPSTDLAVLKIQATGLMATSWGSSDHIVTGSPVWAIGSPFGLQHTVTFGIISGKHRVDFRGTPQGFHGAGIAYRDLMQSDVVLYPGNSGGPLVNSSGEVVGVNSAILGESFQGISFSIPSRVAQKIAEALVEHGEVERGWLGVALADLPESDRHDESGTVLPGVLVGEIPREMPSPARDAGIQAGDIIVSFDAQPVMSQAELMRFIAEAGAGTVVEIGIIRDDAEMSFSVPLKKRLR
ncbi:MAG: trypsin-like peptidase domain-containing protein [Planctomycetales bacterium]|nr:trypsin-like peptidase domain-containing protein [Planctomycetales bacterium]